MRTIVGWAWGILGVAGILVSLNELIRLQFATTGDVLSLVFLLLASVLAGVGAWNYLKGFRGGRQLLVIASVVVAGYCIVFLLMVSGEFGYIWAAANIALLALCLMTLWKLIGARHSS
jgi:hypothetical protein